MTSGGVLRILQLRWRIALLCTAVGIAAATLYLRTATRVYTSTAMIHVEQNTPSVVLDGMDHSARFDNYLYTQAELLKTTPILGEVVKQPGVRDCPTLASATDPIPVLRNLLDCSVGRKNDIVSLSLSSPDSKDAADLLNHVVQSYLDYHSRNTRNTASEILRILKEARQAESVELAEAMARILAFRRANGVLFLDSEKGNIIIQRLGMLSDELKRVELERIAAQVSYESMTALRSDPSKVRALARSLDPNTIAFTQEQAALAEILSSAEVRHAGLLQKHGPAHPAVLEAAAECTSARNQLKRHDETQVQAIVSVVEQRYRAAEQKCSELTAAINRQRELAMDFNAKSVEYAMLESDLKRKEKLCDILESRIKDIDIRGDAGGLNIAVLEWAKASTRPSSPSASRVIALAIMLSLTLSAVAMLACDRLDDRIRDTGESFQTAGLPLLGSVCVTHRLTREKRRGLIASAQGADLYAEVRAALCTPHSRGCGGTILVTSPDAGDGRTTTVSGLASAIAHTGARTLVVDGDYLKPAQHELFEVKQSPGLSELLTAEAAISGAINPTQIPGLDVLPIGARPAVVAQAIGSGACLRLFELLAVAYDYILVDSPPVLAAADVRGLAASCDRTLLVLRSGRTGCGVLARTQHALRQAGATIAGVILRSRPGGTTR